MTETLLQFVRRHLKTRYMDRRVRANSDVDKGVVFTVRHITLVESLDSLHLVLSDEPAPSDRSPTDFRCAWTTLVEPLPEIVPT